MIDNKHYKINEIPKHLLCKMTLKTAIAVFGNSLPDQRVSKHSKAKVNMAAKTKDTILKSY